MTKNCHKSICTMSDFWHMLDRLHTLADIKEKKHRLKNSNDKTATWIITYIHMLFTGIIRWLCNSQLNQARKEKLTWSFFALLLCISWIYLPWMTESGVPMVLTRSTPWFTLPNSILISSQVCEKMSPAMLTLSCACDLEVKVCESWKGGEGLDHQEKLSCAGADFKPQG